MQLSEQYRPAEWSEFVGQEKSIARIRAIMGLSYFDRGAFLLQGPSGCGKTSAAHAMARAMDVHEIAKLEIKGQDCSVDRLRDLSDWFLYAPMAGKFKVAIINECHLMSPAARSYALELMESPPANRIVVLTTTEADWADETLFSRFYRIQFSKPNADQIVEHVQAIAARQGFPLDGINVKRFIQDRHNNIRLVLNDLEIEMAMMQAA